MADEKIWSGRFESQTDALMEKFSVSLPFDQRLFDADIQVNQAWARALVSVGVYSSEEADQVCETLNDIRQQFHAGALTFPAGVEDIHSANERWLTERLGDVGARIHTGRSRNDQVITDLRIYLRERNRELQRALLALQTALVNRAAEHVEVVFPGHTHLQQAQPLSLAHYWLAFFSQLQRDRKRLQQTYARCNVMPLGAGAIAGSAFEVDRFALAQDLRFDRPSDNSIDATSDRDVILDHLHACAQVMTHASRIAEDLIIWASQPFGFVRVHQTFATGSSMMPQKRNPDSLELIRGKSARVIGNMVSGFTLLKGTPTAYVRDLQEDKEPLFDSLDHTMLSIQIFAGVIRTLEICQDRMRESLDPGLYATDLADYLVRKGLPFRQAHSVVGRIVTHAERNAILLKDVKLETMRHYSELFQADVFEVFDPMQSLQKREIYGGTGPMAVKYQLESAKLLLETAE